MFIKREVCHQPFEPGVLLFQLAQPAEFAHAQVRVFLFPGVEGLFGDPELPTDISNRGPTLGLPNGIHDLLFREL